MSQYRKKPIVIEAVQYPLNEYVDNPYTFRETPEWLQRAIHHGTIRSEFRGEDYWYLIIRTLEGDMEVTPNDWIIRGVEGELYPCKPGIFAKTYEPADDEGDALELRMCPLCTEVAMPITSFTYRCPKCGVTADEQVTDTVEP